MNYVCNDCGARFDEPYYYTETHGFTDGMYERLGACPCCGSSDYSVINLWEVLHDDN